MQLNELKKDLQFNTDLVNLIETLKNVAGAQYHSMEKQKERFDQFMDAFSDFFRVVNLVDVDAPLVRVVSDVLGIIIVTSDSGFMGGLNQGVVRAAMDSQGDLPDDKVSLVIIGDKGQSVFSDMGRKFKFFPGIAPETIYEQAVEIKEYVMKEVMEKRMGKVVLGYPKALSFSSQSIEVVNILPCAELFDVDAESEVAQRTASTGILADARNVIIESSFHDILEYLAGVWVTSKLFEVFEDSKLAEFSARAMHLEGSMQKVEKEHAKVKHSVFKAVHELIDKGMRESFSAKMIKEKKKLKKKRARAKEAREAAAAA
ncbi:MAG: F0F1 ATP synthase subunit gamma [Kiritimatiellae bacterium]|nr:F0F1 ATP synthase subunit gamma [Kiritimatiellia bacterium]